MTIEKSGELKLTPINPFTRQQARVLEMRANGLNNKEISERLGLAHSTVKNIISGTLSDPHPEMDNSQLGIYGKIELLTGVRPDRQNLILDLIGDVLLYRQE
jgi:hypothetical protein